MNAHFIRRCLELAERGRGRTGINPLVGSVLVRDGETIAEGWHTEFGAEHAERMLINNLDQDIQQEDGLYVNLEPCDHQGKTPPCTDIIIRSGVKHVVFGMFDPNPEVVGRGVEKLRSAGINVVGPVLETECRRLNRGFVSLHENGRPWITLKTATNRAHQISNEDGSPMKITSKEQDEWSHFWLRRAHDAILVGVGTVISDDPQLNTRFIQPAGRSPKGEGSNKKVDQETPQPIRLILDPDLRIPLDAKVVNGELARNTIIVTTSKTKNQKQETKNQLDERGVRIIDIHLQDDHFDWNSLWQVLTTPTAKFHGISSILVEGGPITWEAFRSAGLVDEEITLVGA